MGNAAEMSLRCVEDMACTLWGFVRGATFPPAVGIGMSPGPVLAVGLPWRGLGLSMGRGDGESRTIGSWESNKRRATADNDRQEIEGRKGRGMSSTVQPWSDSGISE